MNPSPQFQAVVQQAIEQAAAVPDDATRYVLTHVPIIPLAAATPEQAAASGCPNCTFLGLWAPSWPGLPAAPHGYIWIFEDGITALAGPTSMVQAAADVLVHEAGHALERDHVLDAMEREGQQAPVSRGCGLCPSPGFRRLT